MKYIATRFTALTAFAALVGGCATEETLSRDSKPSFEEFEAQTYKEPFEGGQYIVNGDTPVEGIKQLREFYDRLYSESGALIVNRVGSTDDKWNDTAKRNITYCVSSSSFGSRYNTVVSAMNAATTAWEAAGNVNFVHLTQYDSSCTASQSGVVFDVRQVTGGGYLARAFFPSNGRSSRNVLIDSTSFGNIAPYTLTGILRHELGHTLGFRHEHTRPEAGTCFEDNSWRALTTYDGSSVMHYPQCNGTQSGDLTLTTKDRQGTSALYGAPGGTDPGNPGGGTPTTSTFSGSVARGAWYRPSAYSVVAGTTFTVSITGTGDPDLYVRFGSQPTTSSYNCRPYLDGASEQCSLTVPAGQTTAYVGVYGYTAATFSGTVNYTRP